MLAIAALVCLLAVMNEPAPSRDRMTRAERVFVREIDAAAKAALEARTEAEREDADGRLHEAVVRWQQFNRK
jgi:hypothetical protein